jgi:hypothetical protein
MSLSRSLRGILILLALIGLLATWPAARLQASELEDCSIRLIPADAAFYGASLRNGEQLKIIAESNAWKKLMDMPSVQMGLGMLKDQMENGDNEQAAQAKAMLENPQVKDLLGLLADMFSDDVFCYGNADVAEVLELLQDVSNASNYGPLYFMAAGEADAMSRPEMQGKAVLYALAENVDKLKVPTMVMGFSVEDEERATVHLGKLEGFLGLLTLMQPQFAGRVVRQEVGDSQFLTVTVDGEMIPWDEVPLDDLREFEDNEGDVDKIVEKVNELNLVVALGVREGYLMVAVTDSVESLAKLGEGDSLLTRPELDVVKKHADKRLTGISYASEDFITRMAMSAEDLDGLLEIGDVALKELPLDDGAKERIRKDVTELANDLKSLIPKPGAAVGVSFLTDKGTESYGYNWTENFMLDGSQPLDVLSHIGGDPLLAIAWREHVYPDIYDRVIHWVRVGHEYFEEFAVPEMSKKDRRKYKKVVKLVKPLCEQLNDVNRDSLIPACSGQSAIVIDAKLMSKKIAADIPETEEAMPLLEPAIVVGIKDADAMREAYVGYQRFFNDLLEVARELDENGEIPDDYQIPWPEVSETSDTSTLSYTLPSEWGVDEQILPNAVLTDDFAVVTATEAHSARLLESTPPATSGVLADVNRPRAVAVMFNWADTVDALTPWLRLAAREAAKENLGGADDDPEIEAIVAQVDTVLEVLKAMRRCTVECYFEDGALVTHSMMEVQDIE